MLELGRSFPLICGKLSQRILACHPVCPGYVLYISLTSHQDSGNFPFNTRLLPLLRGHLLRIQADNATAVANKRHQGGTSSHTTQMEADLILSWEAHSGSFYHSHPRPRKLSSRLSRFSMSRLSNLFWPLQILHLLCRKEMKSRWLSSCQIWGGAGTPTFSDFWWTLCGHFQVSCPKGQCSSCFSIARW